MLLQRAEGGGAGSSRARMRAFFQQQQAEAEKKGWVGPFGCMFVDAVLSQLVGLRRIHAYTHTHPLTHQPNQIKPKYSAIKRFETTMDPEKARLERIRLREEEERMERKRRRLAMGRVRVDDCCWCVCMLV